MNRTDYKKQYKKRRFRWFRFFLVLTVFIIIAGAAFSVVQYYNGKSAASEDAPKKEEYQFNGSIPNDGEMNVLLLGSDSRGEKHARTDTIIRKSKNSQSLSALCAILMSISPAMATTKLMPLLPLADLI
jgi:anionic cell wall polymer biosynthesis LytR-Cps2A-Psr (LCP) family protein